MHVRNTVTISLLTLLCSLSHAATVSYTNQFPDGPAASNASSTGGRLIGGHELMPLFDPSLGVLTGVEITYFLSGALSSRFAAADSSNQGGGFLNVGYGASGTGSSAIEIGVSIGDWGSSSTHTMASTFNYSTSIPEASCSISSLTDPVSCSSTPVARRVLTSGGIDTSLIDLSVFLAGASQLRIFEDYRITNSVTCDNDPGDSCAMVTEIGTGGQYSVTYTYNVVPVPAAVWLFGSGLIGLAGLARRRKP